MIRIILTHWLTRSLVTVAMMSWLSSSFAGARLEAAQSASTSDPRRDMINVLAADSPHSSLGDQARIWDRFVGTWDVDYGEIAKNGKVTHFSGELVVGWVMDGHALQDLFIADPTSPGGERTMGTTLRYFDNKSGKWHVIYIEPPTNSVVQLTGGQEGDRIVLYAEGRQGSLERWSFNEIKNDSFIWRGEKSADGGKTWRLDEEHHMKRRSPARAAVAAEGQSKSALAFERLAAFLGGQWKGVQDGTEFQVTYKLTANDSVLMEEFRPKNGPMMVTMFSVDGSRLLATHYCSAKNQPQMATEPIGDPQAQSVAFSLQRVTGLTSPGDFHNTGLVVTIEDQDHVTQDWTSLADGRPGKNSFHLIREH